MDIEKAKAYLKEHGFWEYYIEGCWSNGVRQVTFYKNNVYQHQHIIYDRQTLRNATNCKITSFKSLIEFIESK